MAGNEAASGMFEAMNESYDAVIDGVRKANDRTHRFAIAVIEDAQRAQREGVELARQWLEAPLDVQGIASRTVDAASRAQGRTLDATRQFFSEISEAQAEARDVWQRIIAANRTAGEAAADVARGAFNRAGEAVQSAGGDIADTAAGAADGAASRVRESSRATASVLDSNGGV
jgi:hypothetical protein